MYDDVEVDEPTGVAGLFGSFYEFGDLALMAAYEIRSGVRPGDGGTLVANGVGPVEKRIISDGINYDIVQLLVRFPRFVLPPGTYHVGIRPTSWNGRYGLSTTDGVDRWFGDDPNPPPVGRPRANGNAFVDDPGAGRHFVRAEEIPGFSGTIDFSLGVGPFPTRAIAPESLLVPHGRLISGGVEELRLRDGIPVSVLQMYPSTPSAPNIRMEVSATAPSSRPREMLLSWRHRSTSFPLEFTVFSVRAYEPASGTWVTVAQGRPAGIFRDETYGLPDPARYVDPITRAIAVRLDWRDDGAFFPSWRAEVDYVSWQISWSD